MNPRFKYALWIFFGILFFLLTTSLFFSKFYSDKLKSLIVQELNNQLLVKTELEGTIQIIFWKDFPSLQVKTGRLKIWGSPPFEQQLLLQAESVFFKINGQKLFQNQWEFQSITITDASVQLLTNKAGKNNFTFTKAQTKNKEKPDNTLLKIEKAVGENIHLKIDFQHQKIDAESNIEALSLKGNFENKKLAINSFGAATIIKLAIDEKNYISNIKGKWEGTITAIPQDETLQLDFKKFIWAENDLAFSGVFDGQKKFIQLKGKSENQNFETIQKIIPPEFQKQIAAYDISGNADLSYHLEGWTQKPNGLHFAMDLKLNKVKLGLKNSPFHAEDVSAEIHFDNGAKNNLSTSVLQLNHVAGKIDASSFTSQIQIKNLKDPNVQMLLQGTFDVSMFQPFFNENASFYPLSGIIKINSFEGNFNPLHVKNLRSSHDLLLQAHFELENFDARLNNSPIQMASSEVSINYKTIDLKAIDVHWLQAKIRLHLTANNWKSYLFALNQNLPLPEHQLQIRGQVFADTLNLEKWQNALLKKSETSASQNEYRQAGNISGQVQLQIQQFQHQNFVAQNLNAALQFSSNKIAFSQLSAKTLNGSIQGEGHFFFENKQQELNVHLSLQNISVKNLFASFNNFNQSTLLHHHLEGTLHADVHSAMKWHQGKFLSDQLYVYADVNIEKGALKQFEPLTALSRFVKLEELQHIKFSQLKNTFEIKNERLIIPKMFVLSNAFNIGVSGSHQFNQEIDYQVLLNLHDVLGKKFGRKKSDFDAEEIDENKFNLYLNISGTTQKPIVKYERKSMKQKWQEQKEAMKTDLLKPYSPSKEKKDWDTDTEPEEINWD